MRMLVRAPWERRAPARLGAIYFFGGVPRAELGLGVPREIATGRLAAGGPRTFFGGRLPRAGWKPAVPGLFFGGRLPRAGWKPAVPGLFFGRLPRAGWQPAVPGLGPVGNRRSQGLFAGGFLFGCWVFCLGNGWTFFGCWDDGEGDFFC